MAKNSKKVVFKRTFFSENGSFFAFFVIICIKIAATNFFKQLRGVHWYRWFDTCIEECLALVSPAQVFKLLRNCQNAPQGQKIIKWSKTW